MERCFSFVVWAAFRGGKASLFSVPAVNMLNLAEKTERTHVILVRAVRK
jgi:hypothetical protein